MAAKQAPQKSASKAVRASSATRKPAAHAAPRSQAKPSKAKAKATVNAKLKVKVKAKAAVKKDGAGGKPATVAQYLAALPPERREVVAAVREAINRKLPNGYAEGIQYGMIGWFVPHSLFAPGYHCDPKQPLPFAALAAQKNYYSVYLMCTYFAEDQKKWFELAYAKTGKKLDMGKSCVRFKKLDDVALDVIGDAVARVPVDAFVKQYETLLGKSKTRRKS